MIVVGLDGKEYNFTFGKYINNARSTASSHHKRARLLLQKVHPLERVLEEVPLPGTGRQPLYADFFIPRLQTVVEVHGEQHYKFNDFHYRSKLEFYQAVARDKKKKEWCELNDITYI